MTNDHVRDWVTQKHGGVNPPIAIQMRKMRFSTTWGAWFSEPRGVQAFLSKKRVWDGLGPQEQHLDSFANICYNIIYIYILHYMLYYIILYYIILYYIYNDNLFVLKTAVPLYENQPIKRGICEWIEETGRHDLPINVCGWYLASDHPRG